MKRKLEVACFTAESAHIAFASGADRLEFCAAYESGGITPYLHDFIQIRSQIKIPIFIMIRNRAGNFVYNQKEIELMQNQINKFKDAGADGFVFGCLLSNNQIDCESCEVLLKACTHLPCTFHRAFDETSDKTASLKILTELGFSSILTSGGATNAIEGKDEIDKISQQSTIEEKSISIIAGGGIRSANLDMFKKINNLEWFHTSALTSNKKRIDGIEIEKIKFKLKQFDEQ